MVKFILQWHLSEVCNLKCKHCYQEKHIPISLKYDELLSILNQYRSLLHNLNMKGHINLTGGEPLCSPYLFSLLEEFKKDEYLYTFSILTNGTLITRDIAFKLKEYNPEYIQVSLEGSKKMNDYIRGKGVYKKVGIALDYLRQANIFTSISFTATHINYRELPKVIDFAIKHKVNNVWSDRYIPLNNNDLELTMTKEDTKEYLELMAKEKIRLKQKSTFTHLSMNRALQFLYTNDFPYHCTAGNTLLTVMENGDLVPCRRMPIVIGNLLKDDMYTLYQTSKILKGLQSSRIPKFCKNCEHQEKCQGGLKCLTYALKGDLNNKDVGCPF